MFMAYLTQRGEGCDYTIGCGRKMVNLKAKTREDAIKEVEALINGTNDEGGYSDDSELSKCVLIEGTQEDMPLKKWYKEIEDEEKQAQTKEKEDKERAEFERLQKKFAK